MTVVGLLRSTTHTKTLNNRFICVEGDGTTGKSKVRSPQSVLGHWTSSEKATALT
jgi:hypothetical protein